MSGELTAYERLITIRSIIVGTVVLAIVAAVTQVQQMDVLCGLAFGFAISILKLRLQVRNLTRFGVYAKADGRKATGYLMSRSMINIATIGGALLIAFLNPEALHPLFAAAGLFLTNLVIVFSEILGPMLGRNRN